MKMETFEELHKLTQAKAGEYAQAYNQLVEAAIGELVMAGVKPHEVLLMRGAQDATICKLDGPHGRPGTLLYRQWPEYDADGPSIRLRHEWTDEGQRLLDGMEL